MRPLVADGDPPPGTDATRLLSSWFFAFAARPLDPRRKRPQTKSPRLDHTLTTGQTPVCAHTPARHEQGKHRQPTPPQPHFGPRATAHRTTTPTRPTRKRKSAHDETNTKDKDTDDDDDDDDDDDEHTAPTARVTSWKCQRPRARAPARATRAPASSRSARARASRPADDCRLSFFWFFGML